MLKRDFPFCLFLLLSIVCLGNIALSEIIATVDSNVKYVNPLIGTDNPNLPFNYAGMIPSVATPFAMTRWTPYTSESSSLFSSYYYNGKWDSDVGNQSFHGFLGTHQPAVAMGESGEVSVSAGVGKVITAFDDRGLPFSHGDETSSPYYYRAVLKPSDGKNDIIVEASATSRVGQMRFTNRGKSGDVQNLHVVVQATRNMIDGGEVNVDVKNREISGFNPNRGDKVYGPFTADHFNGYFVARFDESFQNYGTYHGSSLVANSTHTTSEKFAPEDSWYGYVPEMGAYVTFPADTAIVNVRVGVSYISIEQARVNLDNEIGDGQSLEETSAKVLDLWAEKLDRVVISNATEDQLAIFYTGMYHALQYPNEMNEVNESGSFYYSGYDDKVHKGKHAYTGFSLWDIYRAEWSFLILFAPERINGMITSMLQTYKEGGRLPIWQNIVETNTMVGTHSSSLIAEALAKGFNEFDTDIAWRAMMKDAMYPPDNDLNTSYTTRETGTGVAARAGLTVLKEKGWVSADVTAYSASRTLDYAYDDYTLYVAGSLLNHTMEAQLFHLRSKSYKYLFNEETKLIQGRFENGSWCDCDDAFIEGSDWVYTFAIPHDMPGMRDMLGGAGPLADHLDEYYEGGHNDQSNEPAQATPFAYLYGNKPWKSQAVLRSLVEESYFNNPVGMNGNEDCGQMSAWYIFNALGFYPVNPSSAEYLVGSPIFDKVEIRFPGNEQPLTILAADAASNQYVKNMRMNGQDVKSPVLTHSQLVAHDGAMLVFEMADTAQSWGVGAFDGLV